MTYEMKIREERKEAAREAKEEILINFIKNGVSIPVAADSTGMTTAEIEKIAEKYHVSVKY
jgi:hypothetical protein